MRNGVDAVALKVASLTKTAAKSTERVRNQLNVAVGQVKKQVNDLKREADALASSVRDISVIGANKAVSDREAIQVYE